MSDRNSDRGGDRNNDRGYRGGGRGRYRGGDRGGGGDRGYIGRNQPYEGERESRGGDRGGDRDYGGGYRGGRGGRGRGDYNNSRQEETARLTCANMFESPDNPDNELGGNPVIEDCGERFGTYGDKITLAANYFRVTHLPQRTLYQYSVEFSPVIESLRARYAILMKTNILTKKVAAFDGSVLYIPFFIEPGDYMSMDRQENPIKITLKHVATVAPGSPPASTVINLIMRRVMKNLDLKLIKRHHFDPQAPISFQEGHLEIWPGYSSTLTYFGKIPFYCVDVAHHVIRQQSAMDFLAQVLQDTREKSSAKQHLERHLVGKVVMTRYNNRSYRIDAIDWELSPNSTFDKKDGTKISYKDYYDQHYNIQIRDNDQPLLVSVLKERRRLHEQKQAEQKGESKPPTEMVVHLIPELVYLTGVSDEVRTNFHMMRGFADITRVNPTRRCNNIYKFLDRVYENPDSKTYLDNWGVEFKKQLVTIPARHFAPESIIFGNRSYSVNPNNYDWNSSLRDCQLLNPAQISNWAVYHSSRDNNAARAFTEAVADRARDFNFQLSQPKMIQINSQNCSELASLIERNNPNDYEVSMFMIPPNRKDLYDMIKTVCCVDSPQVTQVILTSTINKTKGIQSIASKVAIQLCVKRGGEPWTVSIPVKKKMVVGIDVCHDTESKRNSWLGFVASLNDSFTRYFSRATRQPPKTEIADSLNINMKAALESYFKLNGYLPDAIYVFRDGVGDGQLEMVRLQEIPSIMTCLKAIYSEYNVIPTLAYIVVRKRVNARLFTFSRDEASNPEPGSVVDRVITKDDYPNFYLISQKVNQGTVNPTHYIILYNNSKLSTNNIQRLSYKLTHLYFNWTGTVRVPAPCQYAHKLCFLVSQSVKKEPSTQLSNLLYYL